MDCRVRRRASPHDPVVRRPDHPVALAARGFQLSSTYDSDNATVIVDHLQLAQSAGLDCHLIKPVDFGALRKLLAAFNPTLN
jgi:hypothetical protein